MSDDRILIATSTFSREGPEPRRELEASGIAFDVNPLGRRLTPEDIVAQGAAATGIVAGVEPYTAEVLAALPRLRVISRVGVGTDSIDKAAAAARGIAIRNTPDAVAQPVAELTLAMVFDLMRHLTTHTLEMRAHRWTRIVGSLVSGKTLGIVGLGRIGRRVAELAGAVGMTVVGSDIAPDREWAARFGVRLMDVPVLLAASDVVSLHLAASADSPFVLGEAEFARMKPGARLINVARGALVDEAALVAALGSGHLAGAALDVYRDEPYSGPLCDAPNVVLMPHVATLTVESRVMMELQAVQNVIESLRA